MSIRASHWHRRSAKSFGPLLVTILVLVAGVWAWDWLVATERVSRIVLPEPSAVGSALVEVVQSGEFWRDLRITVSEILIGLLIGGVGGYGLAVASLIWPFATRVLNPFVVTFQAIPKIVLLPLLSVWVDAGFQSATMLVVLVSFFPIYVSAALGLRSANPDGVRLLQSLNATRTDIFVKFRMPSALPYLFTGIKTAVNYSLIAAITAEFLGARDGLGYRIVAMSSRFALDDLYAAVIITSVVAGSIYLVTELLDRRIVFWRERS